VDNTKIQSYVLPIIVTTYQWYIGDIPIFIHKIKNMAILTPWAKKILQLYLKSSKEERKVWTKKYLIAVFLFL
jgi:hypothetical protein